MSYEDKRQKMIIRQSQLKMAWEYTQGCGKCLTPVELLHVTELFAQYVEEGYNDKIKERFTKLGEFLDKK